MANLIHTLSIAMDGSLEPTWVVTRFDAEESLSAVPRYRVEVEIPDALDLTEQLGRAVHVTIEHGGPTPRDFHGVVLEASWSVVQHDDHRVLRLLAAPRVALAGIGRGSRIFLDQSVVDVVTSVLSAEDPIAGTGPVVAPDLLRWETNSSYEPHDTLVQHQESDLDFALRLLAEEGIVLCVRNDFDDAHLVFFDDVNGVEVLADAEALDFENTGGEALTALHGVRVIHRAASDQAMLRDYDFHKAAVDLSSQAESDEPTGREVYLHPGSFMDEGRGDRLARVLLDALQARVRTVEASTPYPHVEPGRSFRLEGHPRVDLAGDWHILRVSHRWSASEGYAARFEAIPLDTPFRPADSPAPPALGGPEVAFVTGPPGEELHGSDHGQVTVRFPWDRSGIEDENSSTWLRVGQLALGGPMLIPRVGFEVLVDHERGDVDRPMVSGHLYNGDAMPPYELPGGATISSFQTATLSGGPGANELRIEDAAGSEEVMFNASHDYVCSIENDNRTDVIANEATSTGGNATMKVDANTTRQVIGSQTLDVGGNQTMTVEGDLSHGTAGALTVTVGTRLQTVGGDLSENVTGNLTRTIGGLQCVTGITGYTRRVAGNSSVTVGGAMVEMTAASRASTCVGRLENVGALKFVKAKTVAVSSGAAYARTCASESIKAGGNRSDKAPAIALTASGGLSVKADNVNVTAESKITLVVGGSTITITSSGVKMRSPKVDLGKVKELPSSTHKSN